MARLSSKLRVCKWVGTVGCAMIALTIVFCRWCYFGCDWNWKEHGYSIAVEVGTVHLYQGPGGLHARPGWRVGRAHNPPAGWGWGVFLDRPELVPGILRSSPDSFFVSLPLWLPFVILLIPTLLLWRRDRRKPRPGFCPRCDYDLTGNTTGRCPECGTPCPPAKDAAPPHAG